MSYSATYSGTISVHKNDLVAATTALLDGEADDGPAEDAEDTFCRVLREVASLEDNPTDSLDPASDDVVASFGIHGSTRVHEDLEGALETLAPFARSRVEFSGEDGSVWLVVTISGTYHNLPGRIVYDGEDQILASL